MNITAIVEALVGAGASPEMILAAVRSAEQQKDMAAETARAKARDRVAKWRLAHSGNVTERNTTEQNDLQRLVSGDAPVEDNLLTKVIEPQESKKDSSLRSEAHSTQKRATRLRSESILLPDWRQDALDIGLPEHLIDLEFEKMRDWSMSSRTGAKLDWHATWRNWCREAAARLPRNRNGPETGSKPRSINAELDRRRELRNANELEARISGGGAVLQLSDFSSG